MLTLSDKTGIPLEIIIAKGPYRSIKPFALSFAVFTILFDTNNPKKYPDIEEIVTAIKETKKPVTVPSTDPFKYIMTLDGTGKTISEERIKILYKEYTKESDLNSKSNF